jgi:hypothetical protein
MKPASKISKHVMANSWFSLVRTVLLKNTRKWAFSTLETQRKTK